MIFIITRNVKVCRNKQKIAFNERALTKLLVDYWLLSLKYKNKFDHSNPEMDQNTVKSGGKNWARILFVDYPHLFLPELEKLLSQTEAEVNGLYRILEQFKINRDSKILDLSCGIGRHSIALAKRGYQVVGYDPSCFFLKKAKQRIEDELGSNQKHVTLYEGEINRVADVLSSNAEQDFNVIISMFNSLGYTNTGDDLKLFKDILGLALTGCILITETENRDWRIRNFLPYINYDFEKLQVYENWEFDLESSTARSITRFYEKDAGNNNLQLVLELPTHMRLYSLHELKNLINTSGWMYQKSYGSIQKLQPLSLETQDMVIVSKKLH
jgi:SAM-dependent methyltransferase